MAGKVKILLLACCVMAAMLTMGAARPFAVNATPAGEPLPDGQEQQSAKGVSKADSKEEAEDESAPRSSLMFRNLHP
jgi:hypothetical protein